MCRVGPLAKGRERSELPGIHNQSISALSDEWEMSGRAEECVGKKRKRQASVGASMAGSKRSQMPSEGSTSDAADAHERVRLLGGRTAVKRSELSRVLMAGLSRLGYPRAAEALERESGHTAETPAWRSAEASAMHSSDLDPAIDVAFHASDSPSSALAAQLPLVREEFLQKLVSSPSLDRSAAVHILRHRMRMCKQQLNLAPVALEHLASLLMCSSPEDVASRANWNGPSQDSRRAALAEARRNLPPSSVLPESRLEELMLQALEYQKELADDFNDEPDDFPLLHNIRGSHNSLPLRTYASSTQHTNEVWQVAFSPSGTMLASASKDGKALIFWLGSGCAATQLPRSLPQMKLLHEISAHRCDVNNVAFSPCSNYLATCGTNDKQAHVYCTRTGRLVKKVGRHTDAVISLAWLPDGDGLMTGGLDKVTGLFKMNNILNESLENPPPSNEWVGGRPHDLVIGRHESGRRRAIACCSEANVKLWWIDKLPKWSHFHSEEHIRESTVSVCSLAMSKNLKHMAVTLPTLEVHVWDVSKSPLDGAPLHRYRAYAAPQQARFVLRSSFGGRDESFLATGSDDAHVYIWRRGSASLVARLSGHSGSVNAVAWHPNDPAILASASDDHMVNLWVSPSAWRKRCESQEQHSGDTQMASGQHDFLA